MNLDRNVGSNDRTARLIVGVLLLTWAIAGLGLGSGFGIVFAIIGVVLVGTSVISFCPIYQKLDMNTFSR